MNKFVLKYLRLKYIVPRLLIVLALAATLRFGLDPALHWAIVSSGQSATGAKVEVAAVKTSLLNGEVVLCDLQLANPNAPLRNLIQTGESRLHLDINALLHKRLVIHDGTISGLQFDTDRSTSGQLEEAPDTAEVAQVTSMFDPWLESASQFGDQWLDQLNNRLSQNLVDQLESPKVAAELEQRWPQQYEDLRAQIDTLRQQGKDLEDQVRKVRKNPLRNLEALRELQQQLATANGQLGSLQQQLQSLPGQIETDKLAVLEARARDEQFIRSQLQFTELDADGITQTLLDQPTTQTLATALDWISWARKQVPSKRNQPPKSRGRGTTVVFGQAKPRHWIKQLQLDGQAQLDGEPLHMVGTLTNATSDPHLVAEPTKLSLRSDDGNALAIDLTLDRRGEDASDHLHIACPQLKLPGQTVGNGEKLALQIAPSTASFHIDLTIIGDQLAGEIVFLQPTAQFNVASNTQKNKRLLTTLDAAIGNIKQIEANITLAGTLQKPDIKLRSDLGTQLAAGINSSVKQLLETQSQTLLASTREKVDGQLNRLAEARSKAQQELLAQLGEHQQLLTHLSALGQGGTGLAIPQLSRSLKLDRLTK